MSPSTVSILKMGGGFSLGLGRLLCFRGGVLAGRLVHTVLPVPRPVAARVVRGRFSYQADIVTEKLDALPLADWLGKKRLPATQLEEIGACLCRFHDEGVCHADLNARNVLLDDAGKIYLIDFDRGQLRNVNGRWRQANLERLKRSLEKFRRIERNFAFDDEDWKAILRGYEGSI